MAFIVYWRNIRRFMVGLGLVLGLISSPVGAVERCEQLLLRSEKSLSGSLPVQVAVLDEAFRDAFYVPENYLSGRCNSNVLFLFQDLKSRLPTLQAGDFKVLYITPPNWMKSGYSRQQMSVKNFRDSRYAVETNGVENWNFHVLLVYGDRAYDLDYGDSPEPVTLKELLTDPHYLQETTVLNDGEDDYILAKEQLLIYEIPGQSFLYLNPGMLETSGFSQALVKTVPARTMGEYLKSL